MVASAQANLSISQTSRAFFNSSPKTLLYGPRLGYPKLSGLYPTSLTLSSSKDNEDVEPTSFEPADSTLGVSRTYFNDGIKVGKKAFFNRQQRYFSSSSAIRQSRLETTQVPDFSKYRKSDSSDPSEGKAFTYMMLGGTGVMGAVSAKSFVVDMVQQLAPAADVLALAKTEVELGSIPEGKNVTIKWRGKPVFIRHRTSEEIQDSSSVSLSELRDPQTDADRVKKPEWLVVLGICTHLGCVPIGEAGDYHGWFCPCHGSHYDISGRIRKGPAPTNLEVPPYEFDEDNSKLIIG